MCLEYLKKINRLVIGKNKKLKLKKVTKIGEIFTFDLTVTTYCQIDSEDFSIFVAFLELQENQVKSAKRISVWPIDQCLPTKERNAIT